MKRLCLMLLSIAMISMACTTVTDPDENSGNKYGKFTTYKSKKSPKIQVAILLDTSNSMDGLINQAKSQLWKMVNELAISKKDNVAPDIEIALFEYGNSGISARSGYVREIVSLTSDLDLVSEKLFQLSTNGGDEYCGTVIQEATRSLEWTDNNNDLKMIFIAGNEPFTQGNVDYKEACQNAIKNGIIVNTIHCGPYDTGVQTNWKDGADIADGKYMNIDQDEEVVHIPTPFDDQILQLNNRLNTTYIGFGSLGEERVRMQGLQDSNASKFSEANSVERAVTKSNKKLYKNTSWDMVDAAEEDEEFYDNVKSNDLPEELQKMSKEELKAHVDSKRQERDKIQEEIIELNKQRTAFVEDERKKRGETLTLDNVMLETVREQAESKRFTFEK